MGVNLGISLKVLDYYDYTDKSIVLCRKLSKHTRSMYFKHDKIFCQQLKNRRKFAIYNFDDKVKTLLVNKKFQLLKFFEIDTYLDRRSFVLNFYNFLNDLRNGVYENFSLEDVKIFQMNIAKTKDYHDQVIEIVKSIANIDRISFDLLRLSRIKEEYCITNEVGQDHEQILEFFLSISDEIPEYIKYFQIKGVKTLQASFEFLETCPIQIEILDIADIEPNIDVSGYELSNTLLKSLERVTMSYNSPSNLEEYPDLCGQFIKEQFKFFTEFLSVICKNDCHKAIIECKINREISYQRPVTLIFKDCFFTVFDSAQATFKRYFSSQIEVRIDGAYYDEDYEIDMDDEKVNIFSPKYLSIKKPRFVKNLYQAAKYIKSFISCPIRDVS